MIKVAKGSIILKAEAYAFLTDIYLSFEKDYQKAAFYSKSLHSLYPQNPEYLGQYIQNLLLIKNYDEAEKEIQSFVGHDNKFFQAQIDIFKGLIQEKKYHNLQQSEQYYNKGIKDIARFRDYGNEYTAYAYFGLSRIAAMNGDEQNKKTYRKLALKLADFKEINFDDKTKGGILPKTYTENRAIASSAKPNTGGCTEFHRDRCVSLILINTKMRLTYFFYYTIFQNQGTVFI